MFHLSNRGISALCKSNIFIKNNSTQNYRGNTANISFRPFCSTKGWNFSSREIRGKSHIIK